MENLSKPQIIKGNIAKDERGSVSFANDFDFKGVKRFYIVENSSRDIIRGFHGHLNEEKYVLVTFGKALVCVVEMDDTQSPSKDKEVFRFVLSAEEPMVLHIPGGYANGVRVIEENTKVIFFSTISIEEAKKDDYRFPYDYWGKEVWEI
ncbi:dTDP-4-dehydrorhamnose 3,5-epimerase family protein [Patescibacteria group bacterium]|nr:dTDP-4-dehydrorhamnose 3,5-epimerase family protein [Patescibacteria group bacterium]MBU4162011.1 dTDP-4-dehydrorhamnose 3,5-epimerase family protein [Patescibacteria group bacterium]